MGLLRRRLASGGLRVRSSAGFDRSSSGDADAAEVRGEVGDFATKEQDLLVKSRDEAGHGHPLGRGDVLKDFPEDILQTDAGALAVQPDGTRFEGVAVRGLARKKVTHVSSTTVIVSTTYVVISRPLISPRFARLSRA